METLGAAATGTGFSVFETTGSLPFTSVSGLTSTNAVAFDAAGNLYVGTNTGIGVYAPPYTTQSFAITTLIANPTALTFDGNGNLFVANCPACAGSSSDSVVEFAPPFSAASTPSVVIQTGISKPVALAEDSSNDLFVANLNGGGTGSVTEYASGTSSPSATITNTVAAPNALSIDSTVPALFVSNSAGTVEIYHSPFNGAAPSAAISTTVPGGSSGACGATGSPMIDHPVAVVADPGQNRVFVANSSAGAVNAVVAIRESSLVCRGFFDSGGNPAALVLDGVSQLFVADNSANTVSIVDSLTSSPPNLLNALTVTGPVGLAVAP
jgi:ligand-binding sensor domain-containing protein